MKKLPEIKNAQARLPMEIPRHFGVDVGSSLAGAFSILYSSLREATSLGKLNKVGNVLKFCMKTVFRH